MKKTLAVLFLALSFAFTSVSFAGSNSSKSSGSSSRSSNSSMSSGFKNNSSSNTSRKESNTSFGGFSQNQKSAPNNNQYGGAFQKKADQSYGQKDAMNNWDKRNQPVPTPPSYENKPSNGRSSDYAIEREARRAAEARAREAEARQREYAQRSAQNNGQVVVQQAPQSNNNGMFWGLLAGMAISNNSHSHERPQQTNNNNVYQPLPNSPADNSGAVTVMPSTASTTNTNATPSTAAQSTAPATTTKPLAPLNTVETKKSKEESSGFGTFLFVTLLLGLIGAGIYFMWFRRPEATKNNAIRYKI